MHLRQAIILSLATLGFTVSVISDLPARAEEGTLIAQDANAQINVRALANTQAEIITAGAVGDRVQILGHSTGNDGLVWHHVKLLKSGQLGWIRGDFLQVLGNPKAQPTSKPAGAPPIALVPPQPPASAKSAAPAKPAADKVSPNLTANPEASVPKGLPPAETPQASAEPNRSATIVAFQTPTYAVRVFSQSGQLRLNLFNRQTQKIALKAVPVQSKSTSEGTTYSYLSDVQVTIVVPLSGPPNLTAAALGETLQEKQAEPTFEAAPAAPSP